MLAITMLAGSGIPPAAVETGPPFVDVNVVAEVAVRSANAIEMSAKPVGPPSTAWTAPNPLVAATLLAVNPAVAPLRVSTPPVMVKVRKLFPVPFAPVVNEIVPEKPPC